MSVPEFFLAPYVIHVFEYLYPVHSFIIMIMMIILRDREEVGRGRERGRERNPKQAPCRQRGSNPPATKR